MGSDKKSVRSNYGQTRQGIELMQPVKERNSLQLPQERVETVQDSDNSRSASHNIYYAFDEMLAKDSYDGANFFATEKIRLPRGKVVKDDSLKSSPSHGFRKVRPSASPVAMRMTEGESLRA